MRSGWHLALLLPPGYFLGFIQRERRLGLTRSKRFGSNDARRRKSTTNTAEENGTTRNRRGRTSFAASDASVTLLAYLRGKLPQSGRSQFVSVLFQRSRA